MLSPMPLAMSIGHGRIARAAWIALDWYCLVNGTVFGVSNASRFPSWVDVLDFGDTTALLAG